MRKVLTVLLLVVLMNLAPVDSKLNAESFYYNGYDYNVNENYGRSIESVHGISVGNKVNVRESPSTRARVITQLCKGDDVYVSRFYQGKSGSWYYIAWHSEATGWVSAKYIQIVDR